MSAFILGNDHISVMLQSGSKYVSLPEDYYWQSERYTITGREQEVGTKLINENYRSVNYRYEHCDEFPLDVKPFQWNMCLRKRTPVELIKACDCYSYQTCECPDWTETEAYAIVEALREAAINSLPGYDEAEWSIDC